MKYRIEQKILSLTDSFDIDDENGRLTFTVKGKFFSFSSSQTMYDLADREVLKIKRKYLSILPACRLVAPSGEEWLVRKKFWPFWRAAFSVQTPQGTLEIDGDLWQREYRITHNSQLVARVSKAWFSWSDNYGVEVYRPEWAIPLLGTVIVIDRIQHAGSNSALTDD
jgi:uncharacterized protein YxjI